jgi:hypothetical protein
MRHRSRGRSRRWLSGVLIAAAALLALFVSGLLGVLAGAVLHERGTALLATCMGVALAWMGVGLVLAAPAASFVAGPLKGSGPLGRLLMLAIGTLLFGWGAISGANYAVDALAQPRSVDVRIAHVGIGCARYCIYTRITTDDGIRYDTVDGWRIWSSVPRQARLSVGTASGRVLWIEPR